MESYGIIKNRDGSYNWICSVGIFVNHSDIDDRINHDEKLVCEVNYKDDHKGTNVQTMDNIIDLLGRERIKLSDLEQRLPDAEVKIIK